MTKTRAEASLHSIVEWSSKHQQVAEVLRGLIARGEWVSHLPGYRKLEKKLKVNRSTLERAMECLEADGVIGSPEPGKRRVILQPADRTAGDTEKFLLIVGPRALNDYSPTPRQVIIQLSQGAEHEGFHVVYEWCDFGLGRKSIARLDRLMQDYRVTRLILMLPSPTIGQWATTIQTPCYAIGGETSAVRHLLRGSYVPFSRLVCDAAGTLRNLGHQRILIPIVHGKNLLRESVITESKASWAHDIADLELQRMFADQGQWLPDVLRAFWPKSFAALKPTAVIVKEIHEYLSLLSYCHAAGIRIPTDLSVIQLTGDSTCTWLTPEPSRFELPVKAMCGKALLWLKSPHYRKVGMEMLTARFLQGGTHHKAP